MNRHYQTIVPTAYRPKVDRVIVELRRRRVSYRAISETVDLLTGLRISQAQVQRRCRKLGLPADDPRGGTR